MPIKDLSENVRIPRLGKIHLGYRDPQRGFPVKTDYFVFPKDHSDYEALVKTFGEKPKELRILIPVEDEELWASQYYKAYNLTRGLVCKGDGESAMRMVDIKTGALPEKDTQTVAMKDIPCTGRECPEYKAKKCGEVMNLRFMLPEIPGLGVWQIDTGSINSILNINSCAKVIKQAFGRITLIPLKLTLETVQVNNPESGKKQTVYVLNLRTDVTIAQLANAAREQARTLMISPPDLEAEYDRQVEKDIETLWGEIPSGSQQSAEKPTKPAPVPTPAPVPAEQKPVAVAKATDKPKRSKAKEAEPETKPIEAKPSQVKTSETKPPRDLETVKSFNDLYKACHEDWGIQPANVVKELGYSSQAAISDLPKDCYLKIKATRPDVKPPEK